MTDRICRLAASGAARPGGETAARPGSQDLA